MNLDEALNQLVRHSIDLILDSPGFAVRAKQKDAPRPLGAYASVDFLTDLGVGWEESNYTNRTEDPDLDQSIEGFREYTVSINVFRDSARDNARRIRTGLVRDTIIDLFYSAGVGLGVRSNVRELSETLNGTWEERAQLDVTLHVIGTDESITRSVEALTITGDYQVGSQSTEITIEVN